jgi:hypothetical protein
LKKAACRTVRAPLRTVLYSVPFYFYGTEAWDVQVKAAGSVSDPSSSNPDPELEEEKNLLSFFFQNRSIFVLKPPESISKLQKKLLAIQGDQI